MKRTFLAVLLIISLCILVGCNESNSGEAQLIPHEEKMALGPANPSLMSSAEEIDLVEQMASHREAYRQGLASLRDYYKKTGNNMKYLWADRELEDLNSRTQYNYLIEANMAGPDIKATKSIPAANKLFAEGKALEDEATTLGVIKNSDGLRLALDKYNELIRRYPGSDKMDDAAFGAAQIYNHFKDFSIALLYYQRTYQWNPKTQYPAKFKAAYLLDRYMHRRSEALALYEQVMKDPKAKSTHRSFAEQRYKEMTKVILPEDSL